MIRTFLKNSIKLFQRNKDFKIPRFLQPAQSDIFEIP